MKHRFGWTLIEILIVVVMATIGGVIGYSLYVDESDEPAQRSTPGDVFPGATHIVCLEGHEYFYVQSRYEGFARAAMAPRFDDEGKPRRCRVEKEEK